MAVDCTQVFIDYNHATATVKRGDVAEVTLYSVTEAPEIMHIDINKLATFLDSLRREQNKEDHERTSI